MKTTLIQKLVIGLITSMALFFLYLSVDTCSRADSPVCLMLVEQADRSAIRAKTRYDQPNLRPSRVSWNAIDHLGLAHEVSAPANRNYSYTL